MSKVATESAATQGNSDLVSRARKLIERATKLDADTPADMTARQLLAAAKMLDAAMGMLTNLADALEASDDERQDLAEQLEEMTAELEGDGAAQDAPESDDTTRTGGNPSDPGNAPAMRSVSSEREDNEASRDDTGPASRPEHPDRPATRPASEGASLGDVPSDGAEKHRGSESAQ